MDAEHEPMAGNEEVEEAAKEKTNMKEKETKPKSDADLSEKRDSKLETEKKDPSAGKEAVVDKELLEVCSPELFNPFPFFLHCNLRMC